MYDVAGRQARERADHLLEVMGLVEKRNRMASTLSGGMKRRMNVIMALMHDPDILVFDEPEAGLDPQSRILVREFIRETALRKTVIITTHNMDEADRLAHRVAIMDGGVLLRLDTPERLKHSIGEGDVLELLAGRDDGARLSRIMAALEKMGFHATLDGPSMMVRAMDLLPRIPDIYKAFEKEEMRVSEMRIRENTLEDVFIHLTGKSLRS
jgi:ABC-2 type transport system ATP-binding protein